MKPVCEACGIEDPVMRAALLSQGRFELPEPGTFRGPFLCPGCRQPLLEVIRAVRAEREQQASQSGHGGAPEAAPAQDGEQRPV